MKTQSKILLSSLIAAFSITANATEQAKCNFPAQIFNHGHHKQPVYSSHGYKITNTTSVPEVYHIVYFYYEPINIFPYAQRTKDVLVNPGDTVDQGWESLVAEQKLSFKKDFYMTATTEIYNHNVRLTRCEHKGLLQVR